MNREKRRKEIDDLVLKSFPNHPEILKDKRIWVLALFILNKSDEWDKEAIEEYQKWQLESYMIRERY
jgi:hypothetical protein